MPRIMVEWTIKNEDDHFSYEDIGSLSICLWLVLIQFSLGAFLVKAYIKNIKENERHSKAALLYPRDVQGAVEDEFWALLGGKPD